MFINASINNNAYAKPLDGFVFGQKYIKSQGNPKQRIAFLGLSDPESAYQIAISSYKPCSVEGSLQKLSWFTSFQCVLLKIKDKDNKQYDVVVNINSLSQRLGIQKNKIIAFAKLHNHDVTELVNQRLKELFPPAPPAISSEIEIISLVEKEKEQTAEQNEEPIDNANETELKQDLDEKKEIKPSVEQHKEPESINCKNPDLELEKVESKQENHDNQFMNAIPVAAALFASSQALISYGPATNLITGTASVAIGFHGSVVSSIKIYNNEERGKNFAHLSLYILTLGLGIYKLATSIVSNEVNDSEELDECWRMVDNLSSKAANLSGKVADMCIKHCFGSQSTTDFCREDCPDLYENYLSSNRSYSNS